MLRVHTAGSVGGSTALVAAHLVSSGVHDRVLTVAFEKQSDSDAMWALSVPQPFSPPLLAGAGGYFAPIIRAYMRRSGAPDHIGILVAVKDRVHALKNPYAHLHIEDISFDMVKDSIMLWDPIRYLETCPSSDGAAAMVLASERVADAKASSLSAPPAWVHGMAMRSEPTMFAGRDQVNPQAGRDCAADVYRQAGITEPRREIQVAEVYVPFSWYEPMWLENLGFAAEGEGWKLTDAGATSLDGRRHPLERVGRRAVVEPDRRLGHAAVPGSGHAGAWPGRGAPGRGRAPGARPRVRRRVAVLRHVGARHRQALSPTLRPIRPSTPARHRPRAKWRYAP